MAENKKNTNEKAFDTSNPKVNFGGARMDNHGIIEQAADPKATLKRLIGYFGDFKKLFVFLAIFVIISTAASVAIPSLEGSAIDMINDRNLNKLTLLLIWLAVLFVIQAVTALIQTRLSAKLSLSITKRLRSDLFDHIVRLPIKYMDTHSNGDILSRMTSDVENISSTLSQSLTSFLSALLSVAGTLVVIFIYCWQLTLITMLTVFLTVFATKKLSKIMAGQFRKKAKINGQLNALTNEMVTNYRSVALYGKEDKACEEYGAKAEELRKTGIRAESLSNGVGPVLDCISNIGFVIVAVFGGIFAYNGMITIGIVSAFIVYAKQFIRPVNDIAQIFGSIQTAIAGAERIFELMDEPTEEIDDCQPLDVIPEKEEIEFKNVNFSYIEGTPVIKDFSLKVMPGQKIALVGATGSGKTTLISLLERFYDIDSGDITLNGRSIYDMPLSALRSRIAVVLQDTVLFSGTIAENIKYSDPNASDEKMMSAADIGECTPFIDMMASGFESKLIRAGENISQGQRQLISIARAVMADPEILILDEATSSVDTKTEKQIQDAMANLMKNRTSLIIAHRLSTILDADLIVVMKDGRIAESGTHSDLMNARGIYYSLYMTQFAGRNI